MIFNVLAFQGNYFSLFVGICHLCAITQRKCELSLWRKFKGTYITNQKPIPMKKRILQFLYIVGITGMTLIAANCDAQNVTRDAQGNYTAAPREARTERDSVTGLSYTDAQGKIYSVYVGAKGSHYVCRVSKKSGKFYRQYLKTEE